MLTGGADPAAALARLLARTRQTRASVGDRFPLYADPGGAAWTTTRRGSWTGGYWVGLLWLLAALDDRGEDRAAAAGRTRGLLRHADTDTVTRGMTYWYGAVAGERLAGDADAGDIAAHGARRLADAYDPDLGLIPNGAAFGAGAPAATIDGVVGLVALLAWAADRSGDAGLREIARRHADAHLRLCLRGDGSIRAQADPAGGSCGDCGQPAHWARGQAWGMLALTQAAQWLPDGYAEAAIRTADWWLEHTPRAGLPRCDLDDPSSPPDSSAAAIAAVALLRLHALAAGAAQRYRAAALQTIATLICAHLTPTGPGDGRPAGILLDGCYDPRTATATAHELIWGSYFLAQALAITTGRLDPLAL